MFNTIDMDLGENVPGSAMESFEEIHKKRAYASMK
jgi:hypothetical protein